MLELEVILLFSFAVLFSLMSELSGNLTFYVFAWITWWTLALYIILWTSGPVAIVLIPFGVGWIYLVRLIVYTVSMLKTRGSSE